MPAVSWDRLKRDEPALAAAALRLHVAGLLPLPEGTRVREQHRHRPAAADWVALLDDWVRPCLRPSGDPADAAALEAVRRALPSVGYRLTRTGIRAAASPVDRVLARSASKGTATVEILRAEAAELGGRLRAVVLGESMDAAPSPISSRRARRSRPAASTTVVQASSGWGCRPAIISPKAWL